MICIYCLEDRPQSCFTKVEHVVPQSFGRFKNNLTLHEIVCGRYFVPGIRIDLLGKSESAPECSVCPLRSNPTKRSLRSVPHCQRVPSLPGRVTDHSSRSILRILSPEFLAALAQLEGSGNPIARTYWLTACNGISIRST